jgi:2-polyprenyl-3-methyl-5-hydroxy-6-metoxy-1,4-benzoquinol methylase
MTTSPQRPDADARTMPLGVGAMFEPGVVDAVVDVLARFANRGRALDLGIGTGRIALPLARRGVPVHGIELSRAMVARLRALPERMVTSAIGICASGVARSPHRR